MKKMQLYILGGFLALLSLVSFPQSASAHRDGCHRWHSCPSDSGSYVCGDLGYSSECPVAPQPVHVPVSTTQLVDTNEPVAFHTTMKKTWKEYQGYTKQITAGVNGTRKITTKVTYVDGVKTGAEVISNEVVANPTEAVQMVGKRIKPLATVTKITKQKNGKYSVFCQYKASQKVLLSVDGKKLKKVTTDSKGIFVIKDVKLKSSSNIKIYKVAERKEQQISEKTFVDLKKNRVTTEYAKLHGR